MSFTERWLHAHDAVPEHTSGMAAAARARAQRYPAPIAASWPLVEAAFTHVVPRLLGHLRSADNLDAVAFSQLEQALQHHPLRLVRALYLLQRAPLLEARYHDITPTPPSHPLQDLAHAVRRGRSPQHFDVLVIGSGAGGAPVAARLAEQGLSVGIIEVGSLLSAESAGAAIERRYLSQGMVGSLSADGLTLVMAGSAVGGTTVINSGTSLPPRDDRLASWSATLGLDMGAALAPWIASASHDIGISTPTKDLLDDSARIIARGLAAIGRDGAFVLPRNAPDCSGEGRCCFGCTTGAKQSTDRAYLPAAVGAGASLLTQTRATTIREHAEGVEVFVTHPIDGRRCLHARHLIIAAGALSTPHLLHANRLGARWRHAGDHLRIHPATKVFGLMPKPLAHGGVPQGIGYRPPELPRVTFEGVHTPAAVAAPLVTAAGARHRWWMERYDRLASFGMMVRDRNSGRVRGQGTARRIDYQLHPQDAHDLGAGVLIVAQALFAAGAERVLLPVAGRPCEVESVEALAALSPADFPSAHLITSGFHPQGTAGMGRVVDNDLRLSARVSVCDASVLPDSPGVNPQVTIMALSLRLAQRLAAEL